MNQIAAAHERELISPGCSLHLTVAHPKRDDESSPTRDAAAAIKLQLVEEGKKRVDLNLQNVLVPEERFLF